MLQENGLKLMKKIFEYSKSEKCRKTCKVDFNLQNNLGKTALHYACKLDNFQLYKYLAEMDGGSNIEEDDQDDEWGEMLT